MVTRLGVGPGDNNRILEKSPVVKPPESPEFMEEDRGAEQDPHSVEALGRNKNLLSSGTGVLYRCKCY
jgi:hypothetical protein